jgi:hypothetical protein
MSLIVVSMAVLTGAIVVSGVCATRVPSRLQTSLASLAIILMAGSLRLFVNMAFGAWPTYWAFIGGGTGLVLTLVQVCLRGDSEICRLTTIGSVRTGQLAGLCDAEGLEADGPRQAGAAFEAERTDSFGSRRG